MKVIYTAKSQDNMQSIPWHERDVSVTLESNIYISMIQGGEIPAVRI